MSATHRHTIHYMARGCHGLSKASPGPAMPYPSARCVGGLPLKRSYDLMGVSGVARPQGIQLAARL
jgi:hypothetical protein